MATRDITKAQTNYVPRLNPMSLLNWLFRLDARFQQTQKMKRLDPEARRDMGLPVDASRNVLDRQFLTGKW